MILHKRVRICSSLLTMMVVCALVLGSAMTPLQAAPLEATAEISFTGEELVGLPTDSSVVVNIVPDENIELYYEYGTTSGVYTAQTANSTATAGQPHEMAITGLDANTRYFYRMQYRTPGDDWVVREEHSFWTQRAPGSTFTFTIIADSHLGNMGDSGKYAQAMENVNDDHPDFHLDLGDTFMLDGLTSQSAINNRYLAQRPYMDRVGHSAPIFLASGNHENEEGWNFDDSPSQAIMSINARKLYYPTPITDGFYSGNDDTLAEIDGDHYREDYYAWEWGDALFVVLDPFQYTMSLPYSPMAGETNDEGTPTNDCWTWTLGLEQFNWFKGVLEGSDATYKFVFAHHMVGGMQTYVRGGAVPAHQYEWGGYNSNGTTWGFDTQRSGWGEDTIRDLMIDNGVNAFFHGHDHQYAYEMRDGIVYQSMPSPSMTGDGFNLYSESNEYTIKVLPNSGHLRVTVTPAQATVDYVRSDTTVGGINGQVTYSYVIDGAGAENTPPEAVDDDATTSVDTLVSVDVLDNDSDADSDPLEVTEVSDPAHGTAVIQPDDTVNYTPDSAYVGPDSFTYTINDGNGGTDTATVDVSVTDGSSQGLSFLGGIGSASSKTTGTTLVITTDTAVAAGDDIIVGFATYGNPSYEVSMTDTAGNSYEQAAMAVSYAHGRTYLFAAYNVDPLEIGDEIIITHTEVEVTAAVASAFSGLANEDVLDQSLGNPTANPALNGTTPTVGPTGTTDQTNELLIGVIGTEGPVEDAAGTWAYSFLDGPRDGTTGGDDDSNWTVSMGYREVSATGEYTAEKSGITDRYWAATIATFRAAAAGVTHDLTVAVDPAGGGTTTPAAGVHSYDENEIVDVTAEANPGYEFDHWSGDCSGDVACQVTMDGNKSVTAHFEVIPEGEIEYLGEIGSATSKTSGGTLTITTDTAVPAGADIIVGFATYGNPSYEVSMTDTAGNSYEQAAMAVSYTHGRTYMFVAYNVDPLAVDDEITITHTSVAVRAAVAGAFSGLANEDVLDQSLGNPTGDPALSGTTPTVGPTGTTDQADELLIGVIGTEGPVEDAAGTWDYSFTDGPREGTTGDADDSNWTVSMGYRIVSSTGEYTAQKSGITDRYWAATIGTFRGAEVGVTYDLTVAVDPAGGGTTTPTAGVHTYSEDEIVNVTAEANPGYEFVEWSGACSGSGACQVTMDANKSVTAHFAAIPQYDLTVAVDPVGGGTTTPAAGVHTYDENEIVNVTAEANPGYEFVEWSGACTGSGACQVTMDANKSVTAHFEEIPEGEITYLGEIGSASSKTTGTTLTISAGMAVPAGADIIVGFATYGNPSYTVSVDDTAGNSYEQVAMATSYTHGRTYLFAAYNVDTLAVDDEIIITHTSVAVRAAVASAFSGLANQDVLDQSLEHPTGDPALIGTTPSVGPTNPTDQPNELLIGVIGTEGPVEDAAGTWEYSFLDGPRAGTTGGDDDSNWTVSMGYRVVSAIDGYTAEKSEITERYWAATIGTFRGADVVVTHDLTVAVDPAGGGTTTPTAGVHTYVENEIVDVTAEANPGYEFVEWSGACSGSGACQVTMDADKSVTAHFAAIPQYDLTVAVDPAGGGTTTPGAGVHTYDENEIVNVTAEANPGYEFVEWSGACTGSGACQVTMDANKTVTAHFEAIPEGDIEYLGEIGSATSKTSGGTLTITTDTAVPAGADIIVGFATYGDPDYVVSMTDTAGNSYELAAMATSYQHGRTYIFAAYNVDPLEIGDEIIVTHTSVAVRAAVASAFSGLANEAPLDQSLGYPIDETISSTTPSVGPTGMTDQAAELLIGVIGTEGPLEDAAGTWEHAFLDGPRDGTTGGDDTSNWTASMGYRIVSSTGEYTAEKSEITERNWAATIATFRAAEAGVTHDLTVAVDPTEGGTTIPAPGVYSVVENAIVTITAEANSGYDFDHWSGGCDGSGDCQVPVDEDKIVTAHFVENVPPETTITDAPADPTSNTDASFSFTSSETGSEFECQLDGGGFDGCESPMAYGGLSDGEHVFEVRAIDPVGNVDPTPATHTWTVDTIAPDTTISDAPADPTNVTDASFSFSSNEAGSTFECRLDEGDFGACTSPAGYTGLSDGEHTFEVRAIDVVDNIDQTPATHTWTIDTVAPETSITDAPSSPTSDTSASFSFESSESGSTFECQLDDGGFSACTSPAEYSGLEDGNHSFEVLATDAAGNPDPTPATHSWSIDTIAPDTLITEAPADPTNSTDASFSFESTKLNSTFECQLDGGGFEACSSPQAFSDLVDGEHTFEVRAFDEVGTPDPTPASHTWTVDTAAPDTTITDAPDVLENIAEASFGFESSEAESNFECQLDAGGYEACTSSAEFSELEDGEHTFEVRAIDPAGNPDETPASHTWTIDTAAPDTTITEAPVDPTNSVDASFTFTSNEAESTFECQLDAGGYEACTSPAEFESLAEGEHIFEVRATDAAGNPDPSPASYAWTVDVTAPDTTITEGPADPSYNGDASLSFESTEVGSTFECQLDDGGFGACTSPQAYSGLLDGVHTFDVRATDAAGNPDLTPASHSWTIDTTVQDPDIPDTVITESPSSPSTSHDASFSFESTEVGSTFECQLDGAGFSACTSPQVYTDLDFGEHTFEVRATDSESNTDPTPASYTWSIYRVVLLPIVMR